MLLPTLESLDELGGSGTRDEIDEVAIRRMGLSDDQLAVELPPDSQGRQKGSKVVNRLGWARSYLKKFGAVDNSERGVWTLEPGGRRFLDMEPDAAIEALRAADAEARRHLRARRSANEAARADAEAGEDDPLVDSDTADGDADAPPWQARLLDRLMALTPAAFERLAQRLLRETGFRNVEVTGRSGDRGIDGVGVYRPLLVSFPIYFQCKKWAGSVGSSEVRDFRGAMSGRGEKGLLITTGTFTLEARREATRDGAPPVDLIDGAELCDLLRQTHLGLSTRAVEVVEIDDSFFDGL